MVTDKCVGSDSGGVYKREFAAVRRLMVRLGANSPGPKQDSDRSGLTQVNQSMVKQMYHQTGT